MDDRLYRSRSDRMLAGVAGGLAEMWGADPSLIRVLWAVLVIVTGGLALVVYIVMAIVVPEGDARRWPPTGTQATAGDVSQDQASGVPFAADGPSVRTTGWTTPPPRAVRVGRSGGDSAVPLILGGFLVLLGAFFLVREYLPEIDFDWFWPAMLIVLGVVILVSALGRDRGDPGAS